MKKIASDFKKGFVKLQIENLDDLWYLSHLIDIGDTLFGKTMRKVKLGESTDRQSNIIKKPIFLKITVEKLEYTPASLRALGTVAEGTDDVPKGSYHSFSLEKGVIFTLAKDSWLSFQKKKLEEACNANYNNLLLVVHDREEAYFALLKQSGYEILSSLQGNVAKKEEQHASSGSFYQEVLKKIEEYTIRHNPTTIILASPAFFKEDLMKLCKNDVLKKKIILATCSHVGKTSFDEVVKRDEVKQALQQDRTNKEMKLVDQLLAEISKDNLAVYGIKETSSAAEAGAISVLLVTDGFIKETREAGNYARVDAAMKLVDQNKGEVHIISSEHDGGKKLDGLGGIGAILRYKLSY